MRSGTLNIHDVDDNPDDVYHQDPPPLEASFHMEDLHEITCELINRYPDLYVEIEPHISRSQKTPDLLWLDFYRDNDNSTGGSFLKLSGDTQCSQVSHGSTVFFGETTIHGEVNGTLSAAIRWIEQRFELKRSLEVDNDKLKLQPLEQTITPNLLGAVERLVHAKYYLDSMVDDSLGSYLTEDLGGGINSALFPSDFVLGVFPFVDGFNPCGPEFSALVPTSQTLGFGCDWRNAQGDKKEATTQFVTDSKRASLDPNIHRAEYMWIRPLGLIMPHEGKNRVDFLREESIDFIPARVTPYDYPAASRIQVYRINVKGLNQCWAILDGEMLQAIKHPAWALPVLKAYGVEVFEEWPSNFACEYEVFDEIAKLALPSNLRQLHSNKKYVYFSKVLRRIATEQEEVAVSFDQIRWLRLRSKEKWWWMLPAMILSIGAFSLLPNQIDIYVAEIAGAVFGGIMTLYFACTLKLFIVQRKLLK
jgi:hypothetical protein